MAVSGVGSVKFTIFDFENKGRSKVIEVNNVWYLPSCTKNLISGSQLTSVGFKISSNDRGLGVCSHSGHIIATARSRDGLYFFNTSPKSNVDAQSLESSFFSHRTDKNTRDLIHQRFGHVGLPMLQKIVTSRLKIPIIKKPSFRIEKRSLSCCDVCNSCKQVEKINRNPVPKVSNLLELIHSDTWGKCRATGLYGSLYFVSFTDDASRYCDIYPLRSTQEVPEKFRSYKEKKELLTNRRIKAMRFDGGTEYKRIVFGGIVQQVSAPYTQHQNGVSERMNRTLVTMARCMLLHAGLPLRFWDAAILTASYLRNRLPSLDDKKTPYEYMNGT
ncbi:hypothetical protein K3495_g6645 [Podosphaera aphanis]|nr:hypothetical protein K3495_g6645 [Podosphaera aphanis]